MVISDLIQSFLSNGWQLFGITFPGTNFTFGGIIIGSTLILLSIRIIKFVFGFGSGDTGSGSHSYGSNSEGKLKPHFKYKRR